MPARRKRDDLVQDRRSNRVGKLEVVDGLESDAPAARRGWLKVTKESWGEFWSSPISGAVEPSDMAMVWRLFDYRDMHARCIKRWQKQPYITGSQGQPRPNPAFNEAMAIERSMKAIEDQLGMSPKARAQIGVTFGQAQMTAQELNRQALESGETGDDGDQVVEAELLDEWGEA